MNTKSGLRIDGSAHFDVIVAGGGASGCVLASRLSESSAKRVLLIEAGPDVLPGSEHRDIRNPFPVADSNPHFSWSHLEAIESETSAQPAPYLQGFGLGGGSNINGMGADRGIPSDFDEWREMGALGWGWTDVLPYFRKLEKDDDYPGPLHGDAGPLPIRRVPADEWAPFASAVARALIKRSYRLIEDFNGEFGDGLGPFPISGTTSQRVSASMAYLPQHVRARPNLTILTETQVEYLNSVGRRVIGVTVRDATGSFQMQGGETIVTCGALQSPALLMRSGIGPAEGLRKLEIPVVHDASGVGSNLQNHPALILVAHLPQSAAQPASQRGLLQNILRFSSGHSSCAKQDMLLYPFNRAAWHELGRRTGALTIYVNKPYSKGSVDLVSKDAGASPRVRFNLLEDPRDFERMVDGLEFALELLAEPDVRKACNEIFLPDWEMVARLGRRNLQNAFVAWSIARMLDWAPLRRVLLKNRLVDIEALGSDRRAMEQFVHSNTHAAYHVCGTCRMGGPDSEAVVDPFGRVYGLERLRVADASIFPSVPSANTHLSVLMNAEKIADHVKADWS